MIKNDIEYGRLTVDEEPLLIRFESELFILVTRRGYVPAALVYTVKTKKRFHILLSAQSLSEQLEPIRLSNNGRLLGIEVWVRKAGPDKMSKYILEQ